MMGPIRTKSVLLLLLLLAACQSARNSQANCLQRTVATWNDVGGVLTRYVNCQRATQLCAGETTTVVSAPNVVWQGSCTATFDAAQQDALIANAQQFVNPPTCPTSGKPMTVASWEYSSDAIVGSGHSCVVRVRIHYECCGPANPN